MTKRTATLIFGARAALGAAAGDIAEPIYTSEQNAKRDHGPIATRFVFPLVVNGRVYFGARGEVDVYGLLK
ncbi:MAG TPA: hypothetical protein VEJ67_00700 [Candidatus Cybelea sp.]|nr:hypothetical protein [Candidatus Cybelea sp.]